MAKPSRFALVKLMFGTALFMIVTIISIGWYVELSHSNVAGSLTFMSVKQADGTYWVIVDGLPVIRNISAGRYNRLSIDDDHVYRDVSTRLYKIGLQDRLLSGLVALPFCALLMVVFWADFRRTRGSTIGEDRRESHSSEMD